ncbi:MAG TPA: ParB N-terminal domain-containing protein [Candidatus Acidoferrum sp.]|nr:ParB N-terminal domain-containing protein [Candidatus Acidoferrum sp.]
MAKRSEAVAVAAVAPALQVEMWPIERPVPYPKNARKWSAKAIEKVAASIRDFGWRQPIVCDAQDVIVIGHLRLAAARYLGMTEVPVHVAADLSPAQIRALRIADNRTHEESEWDKQLLGADLIDLKIADFDLGVTGFETDEIIDSVFGGSKKKRKAGDGDSSAQMDGLEFKVVIDCADEHHQTELLARFKGEGLKCRALIS